MSEELITLHPCQGWGCHEHCIVRVHSQDNKITRITKYKTPGKDPVNEICMKGVLSAQMPYLENRITHPLKRVGKRGEGKFVEISWDEALDVIADAILKNSEQYGPESILLNRFWCGYPGDWHSKQADLIYRFSFAWNASHVEQQAVDHGPTWEQAIDNGFPGSNSGKLIKNVGDGSMLLIWGGNPLGFTRPAATTKMILDAQERGAKIVHISNLFDVTSAKADEWVPVKSGTDAALALGMASVIIDEGLYNKQFLLDKTSAAFLIRSDTNKYLREADIADDGDAQTFIALDKDGNIIAIPHPFGQPFAGYDGKTPDLSAIKEINGIECKTAFVRLEEHVQKWNPDAQEKLTGVPAQTCKELAYDYVKHSPATTYVYYGFRYRNGPQTCRAIRVLSLLLGNENEKNAAFIVSGNGSAINLNGLSSAAIQFPPPDQMKSTSRQVPIPEILASFGDPSTQQYKVWLNCMGNPLLNWPNKDLWRNRILPSIDLFVSWEIRMTDTARYADIVLPEVTTYERYELLGDSDDCYFYCKPAITAPEGCKDPAWIWHELAKRLGIRDVFPYDNLKDWCDLAANTGLQGREGVVYDSQTKNEAGTAPMSLAWLERDECVRAAFPPGTPMNNCETNNPLTTSGRLEFYCEELSPVDQMIADYVEPYIGEKEVREEYPLHFYVARHKYFMQGQFTNVPECALLAESQFGVALNPLEAAARGIHDGERVEVCNERGSFEVPLQIRDDIPVGMAHTWYSFDETFYDGLCPQDLMNAENAPEKYTEFADIVGKETVEKFTQVMGAPQSMAFVAGNSTPEGIWDNVCDVKKVVR